MLSKLTLITFNGTNFINAQLTQRILNTETMVGALVLKPNVTSPVWEHFVFQPNEKGEPANLDEPICKICCVPVTRGNTFNLRCHLTNCHPAIEAHLPPQASGRGATSKRTAEAGTSRQLRVAEAFENWSNTTVKVTGINTLHPS